MFLVGAVRDRPSRLGNRGLNLLGLAYVPFLFLDVTVLWRGHLVRPMMHLVLFALVAKLFSLSKERDKWQTTIGLFFVFVTAMATSAGPGIVAYLIVFSSHRFWCWGRFAQLHVLALASVGQRARALRGQPMLIGALALMTLVAAIPLFISLPRLPSPYLLGGGSGGGARYSTGFSDEVSLDVIGSIRSSREVALRLLFESDEPLNSEFRFRGAIFDSYKTTSWSRVGWRAPPSRSIGAPSGSPLATRRQRRGSGCSRSAPRRSSCRPRP